MTREIIGLQRGFSMVVLLVIVAVVILGGIFFINKGGEGKATGENGEVLVETTDITENMAESEKAPMEDSEDVMKKEKEMSDDGAAMAEKDEKMSEEVTEDGMMEKDEISQEPTSLSTPDLELAEGSFESYAENKLALASNGDVILFFHASWCPSCRALEKNIDANLSEIPDGVHILKADYDSETVLKKKYGVVRQHTLVQVDENGNMIKTLTGITNTLSQVVAQIE